MEPHTSLLSAFAGLLFVLGIIFLISYLFKRFAPSLVTGMPKQQQKQIALIDIKPIDPKNRLVLVRCKNKEYLLITGENNAVVDSFDASDDNVPATSKEQNPDA